MLVMTEKKKLQHIHAVLHVQLRNMAPNYKSVPKEDFKPP